MAKAVLVMIVSLVVANSAYSAQEGHGAPAGTQSIGQETYGFFMNAIKDFQTKTAIKDDLAVVKDGKSKGEIGVKTRKDLKEGQGSGKDGQSGRVVRIFGEVRGSIGLARVLRSNRTYPGAIKDRYSHIGHDRGAIKGRYSYMGRDRSAAKIA